MSIIQQLSSILLTLKVAISRTKQMVLEYLHIQLQDHPFNLTINFIISFAIYKN